MLTIGLFSLIIGPLGVLKQKKEIYYRITIGILINCFILSSQSFLCNEIDDLAILGGFFHINNLINGVEIYIYILSILLLSLLSPTISFKTPSSEYFIIILFSLFGMITLISSYDLISTFLAIELQSLSLYIITTISRSFSIAAGLKYYLLGSLSSAILLLGFVLVYSLTGVTQYDSLLSLVNFYSPMTTISSLAIICIIVGLLFKIGAAPFHNWAPDVYDGVPTIITSWIAIMGKLSLSIVLLSLVLLYNSNIIILILGQSGLLSLIIGSLLGLVQHRIKRLLAFSSISHFGFILLALSTTGHSVLTGLTSFLFYLFQYSITLICSFAILIFLANHKTFKGHDLQFISFFKGLFLFNPILTFALILNLFSLTGIPPLIGFFGKQMILYTCLLNGYYLLSIVAILTSVISAAFYLRILKTAIFDIDPIRDQLSHSSYPSTRTSLISWIIVLITLINLLFIINPTIILDYIHLLALSTTM